jgi:long-chain fatty acid transport protein
MKLRAARVAAALLAPAVAAPLGAAGAQGFGLNEIGTCAVAKAGANTSAPCGDASSLYWNPGAVSTLPAGFSVYAGGSLIAIDGRFRQDNTGRVYEGDVPSGAPPFVGFALRTVPRLMLGVAGYVPYGLTSQWRDDFPGRFSAQRAALQTFYLQPTAAYELIPGRLSVGAGAVAGYSRLELRQALDFSQQFAAAPTAANPAGVRFADIGFAPGTEFGRARVKGDATGVGYNVGVHARLTNTVTFGARYLSQVRFRYSDAPAEFTVSPRASDFVFRANPVQGAGGPNDPFLNQVNPGRVAQGLAPLAAGSTLADLTLPQFFSSGALAPGQTANTEITHPAQFQTGLSYSTRRNTLSAEYALIRWKSFDELPINFVRADGVPSPQAPLGLSRTLIEDFTDSHGVRLGGEHRTRADLALRLGASYARTPAPDETVTPLLPDMDRYNFSGGVGIPVRGRYVLDASYLRVETRGRRGRTGERTATQTAEQVNNGFYELTANVFSVGLKARF